MKLFIANITCCESVSILTKTKDEPTIIFNFDGGENMVYKEIIVILPS